MNLVEPYEILTDDHPILRRVAEPVQPGDKLGNMIDRMLVTMKGANGVGLAAPQVGISKRIIIVEVTPGQPVAMINPTVLLRQGNQVFTEGCLSLPGQRRELIRSERVLVQFQEQFGGEKTVGVSGLAAVIVQHEIDHLNGVLMSDHPTANEYIETLITRDGIDAGHRFVAGLEGR